MLGIIIPTDFHIFQRSWNHQPVNAFTHFGAYGSHNNSKCHRILGEFLCRQAGALSLCAWLGRWPRDGYRSSESFFDVVWKSAYWWWKKSYAALDETLETMNGMFTIYQLVQVSVARENQVEILWKQIRQEIRHLSALIAGAGCPSVPCVVGDVRCLTLWSSIACLNGIATWRTRDGRGHWLSSAQREVTYWWPVELWFVLL